MNITKFKNEIEKNPDYVTSIKYIRNHIQNMVEKLLKDKEIDEYESGIPHEDWSTEEQELFADRWDYIGANGVIDLFNELCISIKPLYDSKTIQKSATADIFYYYFGFQDVWSIVSDLPDVEFCYAMNIVSNNIHDSSALNNYIGKPLKQVISKYGSPEMKALFQKKSEKPYAFIAMWFDDSMKRTRRSIFSAVKSCGYDARTVDMKEHNGMIVPEIFFEIRNSHFVIADFTGHRGGVYYEAGYAEALGKQVIQCCSQDSFKDIHFDIAQKNTISWENSDELSEQLIKRIKSTIGVLE